jgi:phosphomannomutase
MISAIAFDLDDTLAPSKSRVPEELAHLLMEMARRMPVCVISGGRFEQFDSQLLGSLVGTADEFANLHLMPTCGTKYFRYEAHEWRMVYSEDLTTEEVQRATAALEHAARELGLWEPDGAVWGDRIENRGSQVTFSALGQEAPVAAKHTWDPTGKKREALRDRIQRDLPDLEVRAGGSTSIDVTRRGIDKAYGIREFAKIVGVDFPNILFVGDRLEPGGNDFPVKSLGVATRAVTGPDDTTAFAREFVAALGAR